MISVIKKQQIVIHFNTKFGKPLIKFIFNKKKCMTVYHQTSFCVQDNARRDFINEYTEKVSNLTLFEHRLTIRSIAEAVRIDK